MPFEPFYHRDPAEPFAQFFGPGDTLNVVVKGECDDMVKMFSFQH